MSVSSALTKIAKTAAKGGMSAVTVIEAAGAVVTAANILMEQAKPLMEDVDMKAVAGNIKAGAKGAGNAMAGAGNAMAGAAGEAASRASAILGKLGDAKDDFAEGLAQAKGEKELRKAIQDARQSVLENATTAIAIADYLKAKAKAGEVALGPVNTMPACFVIATYKKRGFDKNLTDYIGLYIGKAESAAEGIERAIGREGDPDVYADVKYKQNVHAFIYNCMPEELDGLYESLTQTFSDATGESMEGE